MGIPQEQADMLNAKMEAHRRGLETPQDGLSPVSGVPGARKPGNQPYTERKRQRGPNKWESEYAATELEPRLRLTGQIEWYGFEVIKLRLADATHYTPDFAVFPDQLGASELFRMIESISLIAGRPCPPWLRGIQFHEVKGHWRDDALVKFKVAAELFPFARFLALRKRRVAEGGGWEIIKDLNV